jgi:hypothetical protein
MSAVPAPRLDFDEATHTYRLDGRVIPHVTGVLSSLTDYSHIPQEVLRRAQDEGRAIHAMVELDIRGELDVDGLPLWLAPRYAAWCKFKRETEFEPIVAEYRMACPRLRVGGTLDIVGYVHGERRLIDAKRSLYAGRAIGYQLAAYKMLWEREFPLQRIRRRHALVLNDNGTYRFPEFTDPNDEAVFLACLTIHNAGIELHATKHG